MSKQQNPYKEFLERQSEFSHYYACWAKKIIWVGLK